MITVAATSTPTVRSQRMIWGWEDLDILPSASSW
jgi:hypothetical protein